MNKINQQGIAHLLTLLLLLLAIPVGLYLVQTTQIFRPRADNQPPPFSDNQPGNSEFGLSHMPACPSTASKNSFRCNSEVLIDRNGRPTTSTLNPPYGPTQFRTAYGLSGQSSSGNPILALVTAYDHPNIYQDLTTYSQKYSLPMLPECEGAIADSSVPCFKKVDQNGGTTFPSQVDPGWALETAMDVEIAHAICGNCRLLLVEANSATYYDLMAAINQAGSLGAKVISNSWGTVEFDSQNQFDSTLNKPGVAITFSAGDGGYATQFPAASQYVTAVGGTTLTLNLDNTVKSEIAWNGTGSGCSQFETKPSWQKDTACLKRTIADVSAVADPNTGAAVYTSVSFNGVTGWLQVGGTSLASPIIAGAYALGGIPDGIRANSLPYSQGNINNLRDITSGTNGNCPKTLKYLCTAGKGYDGPTGLGVPRGATAF